MCTTRSPIVSRCHSQSPHNTSRESTCRVTVSPHPLVPTSSRAGHPPAITGPSPDSAALPSDALSLSAPLVPGVPTTGAGLTRSAPLSGRRRWVETQLRHTPPVSLAPSLRRRAATAAARQGRAGCGGMVLVCALPDMSSRDLSKHSWCPRSVRRSGGWGWG